MWSVIGACASVDGVQADGPALVEASPPPPLMLDVSALIPGEAWQLTASGVNPGDQVWFIRGGAAGDGPCPARLPVCLGVLSPTVMGVAVADAGGVAQLDGSVPGWVTPGGALALQAASPQTGVVSPVMTQPITTEPPRADFALVDVSADSPRSGELVSPRDYLEAVSGWYFGHAT
jgi:hypothetical protein